MSQTWLRTNCSVRPVPLPKSRDVVGRIIELCIPLRRAFFQTGSGSRIGQLTRSTPTASSDEAGGRWMMVNVDRAATTVLLRHMDRLWQERSPAHPNHHPTFSHSSPVRTLRSMAVADAHQLPSSRVCRRTAAKAARLPARPASARVGGSGPHGRPGGPVPRSDLRLPTAHVVASRAIDALC